jgi:GH43 family beta-xylosidase
VASLLLTAFLQTSSQAGAKGGRGFKNPLNQQYGADPWLVYYNGNYYLATTQWQHNNITMSKSPTIAGLATATQTIIWSDSTAARCCNDWAPEFHLLNGPNGTHWYLYFVAGTSGTNLDNQRLWVLESAGTDPLGPYTFKGQVDPGNNIWAIDPSVFTLKGSLYLLYSAWSGNFQNVYIAPMSNPWTVSGGSTLVTTPTYSWEKVGGNTNEGPEVLQHDGKTFIIFSASSCNTPDYKLGMVTYNGGSPLSSSSWVKSANPVFQRSDTNGVYGPGHNGFFTSPDGTQNWIVYHANASASQGCGSTRTTRVQQFTWNSDGTPNFGIPAALSMNLAIPSGEQKLITASVTGATFTIVNRNSGKCLRVNGGSTSDGGSIDLWTCSSGTDQQWIQDDATNGYYHLVNKKSGKMLDAVNCGTTDGTNVQQWASLGNNCQEWKFTATSDGWTQIINHNSSKVLGAANCGTADGTNVDQWSWSNNNCQQWRLQPVGSRHR